MVDVNPLQVLDMDYSKGGRGKKAPYTSAVCRVPSPLKGIVDDLTERFKGMIDKDEVKDCEDTEELLLALLKDKLVTSNQSNEEEGLTKQEAIEEAKKILSKKKSARISLQKLLQVIYGGDDVEL